VNGEEAEKGVTRSFSVVRSLRHYAESALGDHTKMRICSNVSLTREEISKMTKR
jgi:hypothetical protein